MCTFFTFFVVFNYLLLVKCQVINGQDDYHLEDTNESSKYRTSYDDEDDSVNSVGEDTLILSHVLFRHGNRTADSFAELYPNDPYLNNSYFPYGLGQLTNAGKRREYSIGTALRFRYHNFLGDLYYPQIVEALSTDYNRTKMSLQLVLAGLFPPTGEQNWKEFIDWQPVPYNYVSRSEDKLLLGVLCPNYLRIYEKVSRSVEWQREFRKFKKIFDYVSKQSGLNVTRFQDIYNLYFGLSTEVEFGLELPAWTNAIWPKRITELAIRDYYVSTATTDLRKMASGYLLEKIIKDSFTKITAINRRNDMNGRKIYLYSAHENNVAQLMILLGVYIQMEPHIPNYGAYLLLELHRVNGVYGFQMFPQEKLDAGMIFDQGCGYGCGCIGIVNYFHKNPKNKVFYENYNSSTGPQQLTIPSCGRFCPINQFEALYSQYIPTPQLCGNKPRSA